MYLAVVKAAERGRILGENAADRDAVNRRRADERMYI